jgi:hypothetical protein
MGELTPGFVIALIVCPEAKDVKSVCTPSYGRWRAVEGASKVFLSKSLVYEACNQMKRIFNFEEFPSK